MTDSKGGRVKCPSSMKQTSYTSPATNKTYTIIETKSLRGDWDSDGNYAPKEYTQFNIYDGEKLVQFAFAENEIPISVKHHEFPGWDGIWTSPRD